MQDRQVKREIEELIKTKNSSLKNNGNVKIEGDSSKKSGKENSKDDEDTELLKLITSSAQPKQSKQSKNIPIKQKKAITVNTLVPILEEVSGEDSNFEFNLSHQDILKKSDDQQVLTNFKEIDISDINESKDLDYLDIIQEKPMQQEKSSIFEKTFKSLTQKQIKQDSLKFLDLKSNTPSLEPTTKTVKGSQIDLDLDNQISNSQMKNSTPLNLDDDESILTNDLDANVGEITNSNASPQNQSFNILQDTKFNIENSETGKQGQFLNEQSLVQKGLKEKEEKDSDVEFDLDLGCEDKKDKKKSGDDSSVIGGDEDDSFSDPFEL